VRCTEGGLRATPLKPFPQGVHSGTGEGELSWSESRLAWVARPKRNQESEP